MAFRQQMKKIMHSKGILQNQLSKNSGVSEITISWFLNDKKGSKFSTVEALADALDCEIVLIPKDKAGQPQIDVADDYYFGSILICAVRYSIGRMSYMPGIVIEFIHPLLPYLDDKTLYNLEKDIRTAPTYGHELIDKPGWVKLLAAIQAEQKNREGSK